MQLPKVLFGYKCGIQASTRFSPFMVLTGHTPRFQVDNQLCMLTSTFDEEMNFEQLAKQMISESAFIFELQKLVLSNNA
jgi:hypothetical protein